MNTITIKYLRVYSRCCTFIDTHTRDLWLYFFSWSLQATVFLAKTAVFNISSIYRNTQAGHILKRHISLSLYKHIRAMSSRICTEYCIPLHSFFSSEFPPIFLYWYTNILNDPCNSFGSILNGPEVAVWTILELTFSKK